MKFSTKMILMVALILAVTLSLGGYAIVWTSFEAQLDSEIAIAQEDMQMFSIMLQALDSNEGLDHADLEQLLKNLSPESSPSSNRFAITDESGKCIIRTDSMKTPLEPLSEYSGTIDSHVVEQDGFYIVSVSSLPFCGQTIQLQRERDVTSHFDQAYNNLHRFQLIMVVLLVVSILFTAGFTVVLTKPLSRVAYTATRLAEGNYGERVSVTTSDEVGRVAGTFNEMADALESKIHELDDALTRQKDFTASFAHELKTPLTSVIGYADTLRSRALPPDKQFEAANYIVSEGKRLEAMSFALMDLFALENSTPAFSKMADAPLCEKVKLSCDYFLSNKNIELQTDIEDAELLIAPELIHTLLYNLIDNACKASAEGSVIALKGRKSDAGYVLSVQDHGTGIPQEVLSRIVEPFYMVDKSRARAQGGAGLGLALCSRIAQIHRSSLQFQSILGKGTEVTITLGGVAE